MFCYYDASRFLYMKEIIPNTMFYNIPCYPYYGDTSLSKLAEQANYNTSLRSKIQAQQNETNNFRLQQTMNCLNVSNQYYPEQPVYRKEGCEKKRINNVYDMEQIIYGENPILNWRNEQLRKIEEKYKWIDLIEA